MGGLGALVVIGLYIFIVYNVVRLVKYRWHKAVALVIVILIPTADAIYGRIKLKSMCDAEAGLKINRVVEHVDGFMDETSSLDFWVKEQGYRFTEGRLTSDGKTNRYSRQADGHITEEKHKLPESQFRLRNVYPAKNALFSRHGFLIEEIATGETLSMHIWLTFNGGWAERFLAWFSDAGGGNVARCPDAPDRLDGIKRLVNTTLKH